MAEATGARVQEAVNNFINDIDKSTLRKMQTQMHLCAAKCCENENSTWEQVQQCVEKCSRPLTGAQNYVQNEMNSFQNRLERCVLACEDKIKDKVTSDTSEAEVLSYRGDFEKCMEKCADVHINLLPMMFKRMKDALEKGAKNVHNPTF